MVSGMLTDGLGRAGAGADRFALGAAGCFFLVGLVCGAWKYVAILRAPDARAPLYVDVAHRAALLYAFACALLAELCRRSSLAETTKLVSCAVLVVFFAITVAGYVAHGALRDTDNQLARPHRFGRRTIAPAVMMCFMVLLAVSEIAAFVVLLAGFLADAAQAGAGGPLGR